MPPVSAAAASAAGSSVARDTPPSGRRKKGWLNYPRFGKSGWTKWLPSLRLLLWTGVVVVIAAVGFVGYAYANVKLPAPGDFALAQTTKVYYAPTKEGQAHGSLMGSFAEINREIVDGKDIAQSTKDAIVASEDRSFYSNAGIDPQGLARAVWKMATGGDRQGGSTITQQYIERYYMGTTESLTGKLEEMLLAVKVTNMGQTSKDEILDAYLNTIYFGRGAYGVQTAAQAYFGKKAKDLTVSESAMLVGIVPAPNAYDPAVDEDKATARWNYVLDAMVEMGTLSATERAELTFPKTRKPKTSNALGGPTGYLLDMVRREMADQGYSKSDIETGGYTIVTTIDKDAQDAAVGAMKQLPKDAPKNLGYSLVSIDATTGGIHALWGGKDYVTHPQNAATQDVAQAGSTFKPFALAAALENGKTLNDGYPGYSPMTIDDWTLKNDGNTSYRWLSLWRATANSVNTVYAQLNVDIGPALTKEAAIKAGIPADTQGLNDYPTNVLGVASVHPLDLASAYATLAAQGIYRAPHIVASVSAGPGHAAYQADTTGTRVFDEDTMANVTYAMQQVVQIGTGTKAKVLDRPIAAKTGTTDDSQSAWFAGFTPQLATVVGEWGQDSKGNPIEITPFGGYGSVYGGSVPCDLWLDYMMPALAGYPIEEFPPRPQPVWTPAPQRTYAPQPTQQPTKAPTRKPTKKPTKEPTQQPTQAPTQQPTQAPTQQPTQQPTQEPVEQPTQQPAKEPAKEPAQEPAATTEATPGRSQSEPKPTQTAESP